MNHVLYNLLYADEQCYRNELLPRLKISIQDIISVVPIVFSSRFCRLRQLN